MISFLNPNFFFLIPIAFLILYYFYFFKKTNKNNFNNFDDLVKVYGGNTYFYKIYYFLLSMLSILLIIILAGPVKQIETDNIKRDLFDIRIVFDISYSMMADDIEPTRMSLAKKSLENFFSKIEYSRIGLYVFSGVPYSLVAPTTDYNRLKNSIKDISIYNIDQSVSSLQGTNIGGALLAADSSFDSDDNIIILITDGGSNKGYSLKETLKYLKSKNTRVYVIGIGKEDNVKVNIFDPETGFFNEAVAGGLDEQTLRVLAKQTGGKFYRVVSSKTFGDIFLDIYDNQLKSLKVKDYIDFRPLFLLLFGFMFLITFFYRFLKLKNI